MIHGLDAGPQVSLPKRGWLFIEPFQRQRLGPFRSNSFSSGLEGPDSTEDRGRDAHCEAPDDNEKKTTDRPYPLHGEGEQTRGRKREHRSEAPLAYRGMQPRQGYIARKADVFTLRPVAT